MTIEPAELRELFEYVPETGLIYHRARQGDMFGQERRQAFHAVGFSGYPQGSVKGCSLAAHRVAWALFYGCWPENQIDHVNGDRADNRLANMRDVSHRENMRNRQATARDLPFGVMLRDGKYQAYCGRYLGRFRCVTGAAFAARKARENAGFHENHGRQPVKQKKSHKQETGLDLRNTSGKSKISFDKFGKRWRATVRIGRKVVHVACGPERAAVERALAEYNRTGSLKCSKTADLFE